MHDTIVRLADVWKTCNKIRAAAYRVGLNLWHWYRPLDPDGNTLISESKFVSVLAGPLRPVVGLSDEEISQIADYFRAQDGRVHYHQLCQLIHGEDTGGEKSSSDCLLEACPPPPEPECHQLDKWQLQRLCCLLATIAQRDIPLRPYFQDYELVAKSDGRITFAHFSRILAHVGIRLSPDDFRLLLRRFIKDSCTLDYVAFLAAVDSVRKQGIQGLGPAYQNPTAVIDTQPPKLSRPEVDAGLSTEVLGGRAEVFHPALKPPKPTKNLVESMLRVQELVMQRRIRVSEFFRDFDRLNSGRISLQDFRRCLDAMGLGSVLTPGEMGCIVRHYIDPNDGDRVCWRTFEDDCDQVFTTKELEKHPTFVPGHVAEAVSQLPPSGSAEERGGISGKQLDLAQTALMRIRAAVKERAIDLRPAFRDHDDNNNGHISRSQVRRVLARLGILTTGEQLRALETRYLDDLGFSYMALLGEMEERPVESAVISSRPPPTSPVTTSQLDPNQTDILLILAKIKGNIVRKGIRPLDFLQQYDHHRELVIPRADFYRGLAAAGLSLTPAEMDTLMDVFAAPGRRRFVEYAKFCNTVGESLTQGGLERAPLLQPLQHLPIMEMSNFLNFEERSLLSAALQKLAKYPDQISNILEVFKDMDRESCGSLPRVSVERALCQRNLLTLLSARERDLVYKCFGYRRGCSDEVNYRGLCNALDVIHAASHQAC